MKKKNFIAPEVLVHEMRKLFTTGPSFTGTEYKDNEAPTRLNTLSTPDAPQDVSGMKQSIWE